MKHLRQIFILILCVMLCCIVYADTTESYIIEYPSQQTTVIFNSHSSYDVEKMQFIADHLVSKEYMYEANMEEAVQLRSWSWCWLTGHDFTTSVVMVINHKQRTTIPRCLQKSYKVTTCSKYDYYEEELISSVYIQCCPED